MRKQGTCAFPGDRTSGKGTVMFEALQSRSILRRQFVDEPQLNQVCKTSIGFFIFVVLCAVTFTLMGGSLAHAQNPAPSTENLKKANTRPAEAPAPVRDPFEGA